MLTDGIFVGSAAVKGEAMEGAMLFHRRRLLGASQDMVGSTRTPQEMLVPLVQTPHVDMDETTPAKATSSFASAFPAITLGGDKITVTMIEQVLKRFFVNENAGVVELTALNMDYFIQVSVASACAVLQHEPCATTP